MTRVKNYINGTSGDHRNFLIAFFNATLRIDHEGFCKIMSKCISDFAEITNNEPFYILLDEEVGLQHWITTLMWSEIRKLNIIDVIAGDYASRSTLVIPGSMFVIISHIFYSGNPITTLIDKFVRETKVPYTSMRKVKFRTLSPFMSGKCEDDMCRFASMRCYDIKMFRVISLKPLWMMINLERYCYLNSVDNPPIVFSHDVAVYQSIYLDENLVDDSNINDKIVELQSMLK